MDDVSSEAVADLFGVHGLLMTLFDNGYLPNLLFR